MAPNNPTPLEKVLTEINIRLSTDVGVATNLPGTLSAGYSTESLESISSSTVAKPVILPEKRQHRLLRHVRHTFMNVYRRIFSIVFLLNIIGLGFILCRSYQTESGRLVDVATAAATNCLMAIVIRQDFIINALFKVCWSMTFMPLKVRRLLAKIYEFGGLVRQFFSSVYSSPRPQVPCCSINRLPRVFDHLAPSSDGCENPT
jgi:hypothetical protein